MAEQLTKQQAQAVENRGGKLLVSAAAGSGKTKVLVDRLMMYLTDEHDAANLDEFLIITYTKAAAAELRGKIAKKLNERIAQDPQNRHLQQQLQRLYLTKISTVHSFCTDVLREYAYKLELPSDFRMADENECRQLRDMVMESLLDEAYQSVDPDFLAFVDTQGLGRTDQLVGEIIEKVYNSALCHLDSEAWLDGCVENARVTDLNDAAQITWGRYLMEDLFAYLDRQIASLEQCIRLGDCEELSKPVTLLRDTVFQLQHLRASQSWDEIVSRKHINYGTLTFPKKFPDKELTERMKAVRNGCKDGLAKKLRAFADESAQVLQDLEQSTAAVRGMVDLVRQFKNRYDTAKRHLRVMDFSDLEHRTLDLLLGKRRTGATSAAHEIGSRYREIMVDEYQDSNAVQDAIFSALTTKRNNLFMVGDVKQSIYQFRLADPGIFLEKYAAYAPVEQATAGEGRKVLLSSNFRSGWAVLNASNDVFRYCMSPAVGGLYYGQEEALSEGIPHIPLGEPEVEFHALSTGEDTYAEEAEYVAQQILELLGGEHHVRDGKELRRITADDIVILLRSPGSAGRYFKNALERRGIRCTSGGGNDLLKTREIGTLRSLLQTISNPHQDIPLLAALMSPLFGFTADDLARIRSGNRHCSVFDALQADDSGKTGRFLETLSQLRLDARTKTLAQLLESIFAMTNMDAIFAAMEDGEVRQANLQAFYQLAVDFENGMRRDLSQFLDHLDAFDEKGLKTDGESASGAVTIMSIHKSKGLEFPVVFLSNLSRGFNMESLNAQVLCDKELGLGLSCVDRKNRVRYPTISRRAIGVKAKAESISEELRVLYVAMTRAKDRLIMTYASKRLAKDIAELALRMDLSHRELLTGEVSCPGEWVLLTALQRTEAGELFALGGKPENTTLGDPVWRICVRETELSAAETEDRVSAPSLPKGVEEQLRQSLAFRYGYLAATMAPSKQTATQRKGRIKDEEAAEGTSEPVVYKRTWRKPSFVEKKTQSKDRGSAIHAALEHIRYDACTSEDSIRREISRMADSGFLTPEQASLVDVSMLGAFFATPMGKRLGMEKNVLREFKFSILDEGESYGAELSGEKVLLQGVVDCAIVEEDGIIVLDFKTDRVTEEDLELRVAHYRPQVEAYAQALSRIFEKEVKESYLYFFQLNRFVKL
jgi:ATP-dependent helicase/nuclease subunit A